MAKSDRYCAGSDGKEKELGGARTKLPGFCAMSRATITHMRAAPAMPRVGTLGSTHTHMPHGVGDDATRLLCYSIAMYRVLGRSLKIAHLLHTRTSTYTFPSTPHHNTGARQGRAKSPLQPARASRLPPPHAHLARQGDRPKRPTRAPRSGRGGQRIAARESRVDARHRVGLVREQHAVRRLAAALSADAARRGGERLRRLLIRRVRLGAVGGGVNAAMPAGSVRGK